MRSLKYVVPLLFLAGFALAQTPTPTPAVIPGEPTSVEEAIGLIGAIIKFFKSGQILLGLALLTNILIFTVKNYAKWLRIPAEWKVPVITGLGLVLTIVARFVSGASWGIEWIFAFMSGPFAIFIHQLVSRFKGDEAPVPE